MYRYKKYWSRKASNKSGRVHGGKRKDPVYEKMPGHIGHSRNRPDPPLLFKKITVRRPLWKRKARPRKVRRERPPHRAGLRIPRILWRTPPLPHWIPPLPQNRPQRRTLPPKNTTTDPITSPTASATETPTEPSAAPPPVMEPEPKMNVLVIGGFQYGIRPHHRPAGGNFWRATAANMPTDTGRCQLTSSVASATVSTLKTTVSGQGTI